MEEQALISHIEDLGLSNKEARVYVAALATGPASVQRLADQSGIKRVTVYVILESLIGLGLISQSTKGKKTVFVPEDPSNLQRLIDKRQHELDLQRSNFDSIMPQLSALGSGPRETAMVRLYDSADGIKSLMRTFIKEAVGTDDHVVIGFSNLDELYDSFPEFRQTHSNPDRLRAGIKSRFLYASSEGPIMKAFDRETQRVSRWIPLEKFPTQGDFTVVGDQIMMLSFQGKHPVGITIASPDLAQGLRTMFDLAWAAAEEYNK